LGISVTIDKANWTIDRLNGDLNALKNNGDRLFIDFKAERDRWRDVEARLARIEGKSREVDESTTRSSSSSAKRKAEEHPPPTQLTALPSTTTLVDGLPPLKKWATEGGPSDSAYDPYDPDNWAPGMYVEDYLDYGRAKSSSTGPAMQGRKKGDNVLRCPEIVPLPKRNIDTRPVASRPTSITGVLPRPLGKTAAKPAIQAQQWFDECDVDDLWLDALYQEARAISRRERNLAQRVAFTHVTGNLHKIAKPDIFPMEDNLPDDIRHWIAYWSRNPFGIP